jgi:hypothetical protein
MTLITFNPILYMYRNGWTINVQFQALHVLIHIPFPSLFIVIF